MGGSRLPGDDSFRAGRLFRDDEESLRKLFDRYYSPILHFFVNRGFSREESQDLAQEAFLRAFQGIDRFRGEASFQTWLLQIAANVWRNEIRHRSTAKRAAIEIPLEEAAQRKSAVEDESEEGAEAEERAGVLAIAARQPERLEDILAEERTALLRQALAELPPQMRRCVMLRIGHNLGYREISSTLGISIGTVASQLSQAKARLKEKLGQYFPDIEIG